MVNFKRFESRFAMKWRLKNQRMNITSNNLGDFKVDTLSSHYLNHREYWSATLYYPRTGDNLPGLSIIPGYLGGKRHVEPWANFIASYGIIVLALEPKSIFNKPKKRAKALLGGIDVIVKENSREESPLFGRVDVDSMAVAGASMGGGAAQIAAKIRPTLKAVFSAVPWLEGLNGHPKDVVSNINWEGPTVPVLFIGGDRDTTAPIETYTNPQYLLTKGPKMKLILAGVGHSAGCWPEQRKNLVGRIVVAWLQYYLKNDETKLEYLVSCPKGNDIFEYDFGEGCSSSKSDRPINPTAVYAQSVKTSLPSSITNDSVWAFIRSFWS